MTLVSVITPTWGRHEMLCTRAIASVQAQLYQQIEHIVISDGPDPALEQLLADQPVKYLECPEHDEHPMNFGSAARNWGLREAKGELIAYLDDDNIWRPDHLTLLVRALDDVPSAGFAYGLMLTHPEEYLVGSVPPSYGGIDTSMIVQRRGLLETSRWPTPNEINGDQHAPDWGIVAQWLSAGVSWVHLPIVTVDYYFAGCVPP